MYLFWPQTDQLYLFLAATQKQTHDELEWREKQTRKQEKEGTAKKTQHTTRKWHWAVSDDKRRVRSLVVTTAWRRATSL